MGETTKHKSHGTEPATFADFARSHGQALVRIYLSNGERREGVLVVHDDYVTLDGQVGGYPLAHVVAIVPLSSSAPGVAGKKAPRATKRERS